MKLAILGIDARYTVEQSYISSFLVQWVARFEDKVIAVCEGRKLAEDTCRYHDSMQTCWEES